MLDEHFSPAVGFLDLDLAELKFDSGRVVIRDETLVADGV